MSVIKIVKSLTPPIAYNLIHNVCRGKKNYSISNNQLRNEKEILQHYIDEINNRSECDVSEIQILSKDITFDEIESISTNITETNYYGNWYVIQRYLGKRILNIPPLDLAIQHGIIWEITDWDKKKKEAINLVWAPYIAQLYKNIVGAENVIPIGSPFYYSESLFSNDYILSERQRLGHNLLAFPLHSTHFMDNNWNVSHFISTLKNELKKFDSVRVCVYWKDVQRGLAKVFNDNGFECVCCGHLFDQFFLDRQHTLLEICDATISNGIGSHIGNSIYMNRPHRIVPDKFEVVDLVGKEGREHMELYKSSMNRKRIMMPFINNNNYDITPDQIKIVDEFWGKKISREELENKISEILFKR